MSGVIGTNSGFFDESGFEGLDRNEDAFGAAVFGFDADALEVGAEFAFGGLGDVRPDAAAFFGLTFAVNDGALDGAFAGDCTNSCHGCCVLKGAE